MGQFVRTLHLFLKKGCNKMTCRCGSMQCYVCRRPVRSYEEHFCQHVTEGQQCRQCSKCLLFEDVGKKDEEKVEMERQQGAECLVEKGYLAQGNTIFNGSGVKVPGEKATRTSNHVGLKDETIPKRICTSSEDPVTVQNPRAPDSRPSTSAGPSTFNRSFQQYSDNYFYNYSYDDSSEEEWD